MRYYGQHLGYLYPCFLFTNSEWELPVIVWRPQDARDGEGWIARRLGYIMLLSEHRVPVPQNAYWFNVETSTTKGGHIRLDTAKGDCTTAVFFPISGVTAEVGTEVGGAFNLTGSEPNEDMAILWLQANSSVQLSDGRTVTFNGREVIGL